MKLTTITTALSLAATTLAVPKQLTNNWCPHPKYLWLSLNATGGVPASATLPRLEAWTYNITGQGNQVTVANASVPFGQAIGRLLLGTSYADNVVYWSVSNIDGPLPKVPFNVTVTGGASQCDNSTSYDATTHGCYGENVVVTLNLCSDIGMRASADVAEKMLDNSL